MSAKIRKTQVIVETTHSDIGRAVDPPTRKAAAMAVIENPFAGAYAEDLSELMDIGAELGGLLGRMCVEALGIAPGAAESYGKAAIVGENGEWEHGAAILHPKLGAPLRNEVEKGAALVPFGPAVPARRRAHQGRVDRRRRAALKAFSAHAELHRPERKTR